MIICHLARVWHVVISTRKSWKILNSDAELYRRIEICFEKDRCKPAWQSVRGVDFDFEAQDSHLFLIL